jgi:tetrahydrodipicolinate N-succinyltransferase
LTEVATGQTSSKLSSDGTFIVTNLKPGVYNVTAEAAGFKQTVREGVRLATGERVRLEIQLAPGTIDEMVTVTQDAPLLRTESGSSLD